MPLRLLLTATLLFGCGASRNASPAVPVTTELLPAAPAAPVVGATSTTVAAVAPDPPPLAVGCTLGVSGSTLEHLVADVFADAGRGASIEDRVWWLQDDLAPLRAELGASLLLARIRATQACPVWWDGEHVGLDDPELGELPLEVRNCASGERQHCLDLLGAEHAYRRRLETRALLSWLRAHPDARISESHHYPLRIFLARDPTSAIVCLGRGPEHEVHGVPETGRCFRVTPSVASAAVTARVVSHPVEPGEEPPMDVDRIVVMLDDRTYRLTDAGLVPTRRVPRPRSSTDVAGVFPMGTARGAVRVVNVDPAEIPPLDALDDLMPDELGDSCIGGSGAVLCCVVGGLWRCADPSTLDRIGRMHPQSLRITSEGLTFVWEHGLGTSGHYYHWHELHELLEIMTADGDVLRDDASLVLAYEEVHEEVVGDYDPDGEPPEHAPWEGTQRRIEWSYQVLGPGCVDYLDVSDAHTVEHGGATTEHETHLEPVTFSVVPPALPRFAPETRRSEGPYLLDGGHVVDRRGLWQLGDGGWAYVDACDP